MANYGVVQTNFAIRATIYRSLRALRGQNRKKVSKRVFLGVRKKVPHLEAQQRYFSYRAILVAIVSQNLFVLVFMGIAQLSRDMLQNGVSHRCAYVKLSAKGGIAPFWGSAELP